MLDVDPPDGERTLAELQREHGELPATIEVITPRGGRHLWFQPQAGIRNSAGRLGPGLDVRGRGGFGIVPSSAVDGRPYTWSVNAGSTIAIAPAWLVSLLRKTATTRSQSTAAPRAGDWIQTAEPIAEGQRDMTLTRISGHLLRRGVDPRLAWTLVHALNEARCRPPLPAAQIDKIVGSIADRELRQRKAADG